jgi:hypothetical protein
VLNGSLQIQIAKNMDLFFKLPKYKAERVIREAMSISKWIKTDQLDCKISFRRQNTDKTPEEVLTMGLKDKFTLWHYVIRYQYENIPARTDIGLSTGIEITYFLWIDVDVDKAYDLAMKYKLKRM